MGTTCTDVRLGDRVFTLAIDGEQLRVRHPGELITAEIVDEYVVSATTDNTDA